MIAEFPPVENKNRPIVVGDRVRSYDFPEYLKMDGAGGDRVRGSYVDGVVEHIGFNSSERLQGYTIKIEASVYGGKPYVYDPPQTHVFLPLNGLRKRGGKGFYDHVKLRA